jgi:hypothetical protein
MKKLREYSARWLAFCSKNNISPDRQSDNNSDYIIWINDKWKIWSNAAGTARPFLPEHHQVFDKWLENSI